MGSASLLSFPPASPSRPRRQWCARLLSVEKIPRRPRAERADDLHRKLLTVLEQARRARRGGHRPITAASCDAIAPRLFPALRRDVSLGCWTLSERHVATSFSVFPTTHGRTASPLPVAPRTRVCRLRRPSAALFAAGRAAPRVDPLVATHPIDRVMSPHHAISFSASRTCRATHG